MDNIIDIFISPFRAFERIKRNPDFLFPFIIFIVFMSFAGSCAETEREIIKQEIVLKEKGYSEAQIAKFKDIARGFGIIFSSILFIFILTPFTLLGFSLYAYFLSIICKILKNKKYFREFLSLIAYTSFLIPFGIFLEFILMFILRFNIDFSLSSFYPLKSFSSFYQVFLKIFLSNISIFTIWSLILLSEGVSYISEVRKKISYLLVFGFYTIENFVITFPLSLFIYKFLAIKLKGGML